ncbi:MAG: type II toxin-antitoxin system HicA family toxin [Candidatus Brocadiaceae bacterium]|nr:type II toxin-antitoxin system HicA family toxin [Candidatus Brocadiaceae bacterium]
MTGKLPSVSSKEIINALLLAGFTYAPKRGKGSHTALYKVVEGGKKRLVIIPKRKDIPKGTLHAILGQAGITKEDFIHLLKG